MTDRGPKDSASLDDLEELVSYLTRSSKLEPPEARRLVDEVLAYLTEAPEAFIRRRHLELQRSGLSNAAIFDRLELELCRRRFPAPTYTARQLRRIIYG
jgi:hypothetical protein